MGKHQPALAVGVAWYRYGQWERLREVSEDRADLEDTWAEWIGDAEELLRGLGAKGIRAEKVDVDVEELVRWCQADQKPINAASRSAFAAEMLRRGGGE
jgi:hypothetical protein